LHGDVLVAADLRDQKGHPTGGGLYQFVAATYLDRDSGTYTFRRYEVDGAQFVPDFQMSTNLTAVLQELLQNTTNVTVLRQLMTPDATYVSLNFDNPELKTIMPWTGTHRGLRRFRMSLRRSNASGKHSTSRSSTPLSKVTASPSSALLHTNRSRPGRKSPLRLTFWRVSRRKGSRTSSFSKTATALRVRSKQAAQHGFTVIPREKRLRPKAE